ncbi:thiamine pyrophosphate-binding protein [Aestuariicella hydrocarbonica]|uniref:Thiamine pyrophosphate-binding protein n=1 Tax=Pseudomaricurvus hydrocarbonicus TaxID=1470433 RepID=A0A9E5MM33_9GAMM|nr:thiamine pyrophosphate-binding protein [Aestuariicella hydrocarbonica]NHO66158.1 thiamine pyrophosphate-binding protein [Aestuariicella hydrocarbonica]
MSVKVYERILELFEAEGIKAIFGIPDPNFVHMFVAAEKRGWTVVTPHHELAAGMMAEAYARMNGTPAVCISTLGPGIALNAGSMMNSLVENSPVIYIGGQRARITERRVRRGRIQFIQQEALFKNSVKWSASIEYADQTDEIIRQALRVCQSGTPGPVYIEYPSNVILEDLDVPPALPPSSYRLVEPGADGNMVAKALELIKNAECPVLLVGHAVQCTRSGQKIRELAELMGCPVIQTSGGTAFIEGIEDRTFPYMFSEVANEIVTKSDVVVAIGTEIGEPVHYGVGMYWKEGNVDRKWVYVELDAEAIGQNRPIDVPLVGDLRTVVPQLSAGLKDSPRTEHAELARWVKEDKQRLTALAEQDFSTPSGRVHTGQWVIEATKAMPEDAIHVRDGGCTVIFTWTYLQSKPRDVIWNQNFGCLGTGLPYAVGASIADGGKRPVLFTTSDSAFLYHIAELEVVQRFNLPMVIVVAVDNAWGLEVGVYKRTFGHGNTTEPGVHWSTNVRFDEIARGHGCEGMYVEKGEDLGAAIDAAFASGKPTVIHVPIDPVINHGGNENKDTPNYERFRTWYAEGQQ